VRHGTLTLFAALNYLEGKLITRLAPRHHHQGLCAKIGLFQSSRSVFVQASISARKPIAGESNHALSASGGISKARTSKIAPTRTRIPR
jgi:hypothetical protein